jgi:hypothetical protein
LVTESRVKLRPQEQVVRQVKFSIKNDFNPHGNLSYSRREANIFRKFQEEDRGLVQRW